MNQELESRFVSCFEKNKGKLFRICSIYTSREEDAKDLFQEVLMQIWTSLGAFGNRSSLETWMFRIALNVSLKFRSNNIKKRNRLVFVEYEMAEDPRENQHHQIQLTRLRRCIRKLNEADRALIALYLEELPYREISEITGLTENTIAVKIKRLKKKLLSCLNEES